MKYISQDTGRHFGLTDDQYQQFEALAKKAEASLGGKPSFEEIQKHFEEAEKEMASRSISVESGRTIVH